MVEPDTANIIDFHFQTTVNPEVLVPLLERLIGERLRPLMSGAEHDSIDYVISDYKTGFVQCITLYWKERPGYRPVKHDWLIARQLSDETGVRVATFVPPGYPEYDIPGYWCVAEPDGSMALVYEDDDSESDGLMLSKLRKPFRPGEW